MPETGDTVDRKGSRPVSSCGEERRALRRGASWRAVAHAITCAVFSERDWWCFTSCKDVFVTSHIDSDAS